MRCTPYGRDAEIGSQQGYEIFSSHSFSGITGEHVGLRASGHPAMERVHCDRPGRMSGVRFLLEAEGAGRIERRCEAGNFHLERVHCERTGRMPGVRFLLEPVSTAGRIERRFVQKQNRPSSRSRAVIIVERSTESLAPMHRTEMVDDRSRGRSQRRSGSCRVRLCTAWSRWTAPAPA